MGYGCEPWAARRQDYRNRWYALTGGIVTTDAGPHWAAHTVVRVESDDLAARIAREHNTAIAEAERQ